MNLKSSWLCRAALAAVTCLAIAPAQSQEWPSRSVRLIVPYGAGGTPDIIARSVGEKLRESTGQAVIVDNKPGAGGVIAINELLAAAPDGYTLLMADTGHLAVNPSLRDNLPYDPIKDFTPIIRVSHQAFSVVVNSALPVNSVEELVALSKKNEKGLFYGSSGLGSMHHISGEQLRVITGGKFTHVPYKGVQYSVPALLAGDIDFIMFSATPVMSQWKTNKVKILARAGLQRSSLMPDVPTLKEVGIPLTVTIDVGLVAPKGTPSNIVQRMNEEIRKALNDPAVKQRFEGQDFEILPSTSQEFAQIIDADLQRYRKVVKESNIKVE